MKGLFLLSNAQMARISPYFPLSHGVPLVNGRRVVNGIVYVIRNCLQWRDAPKAYGPHKTLASLLKEGVLHAASGARKAA